MKRRVCLANLLVLGGDNVNGRSINPNHMERCDLQSDSCSKKVTQDGSSAVKVTRFTFFQQSACVSKVTPKSAKTKEVVLGLGSEVL